MSRYGYDDAGLTAIVSATGTAIDLMNGVNRQVYALSGQLPAVNNSTSGQRLAAVLGNWNSDFGRVVTQLTLLNEKATTLLRANRTANSDAEVASGGAQ